MLKEKNGVFFLEFCFIVECGGKKKGKKNGMMVL